MIASSPLSSRAIAFRLALLYAMTFLTYGVQIPFLPVWLGARGLDDQNIAFVLAAPLFLRVVSTPLFARWADKRGDFVGVLALSLIVMTALCVAMIFISGFAAIFVAVTLFSCAQGVAMPLNDALTFAVLRAQNQWRALTGANNAAAPRPLEYGRIRKWGSAAFILGNIVAGVFLSLTSVSAIPYGLAAFALLSVGAAYYAAPLGVLAHAPAPLESGRSGARGPGLLIPVIAAAALIQASHSLVNTFGSLHWAREGYSSVFIGAAWALGVVCETAFFAFVGRWVAGPDRAAGLLALGGVTAVLRWLIMASDPGGVLLALAQAGHGFSFAATHTGSMFLIFELAPNAMRARAQGWLTAAIAGVSGIVVTLSGPLYAGFGEIAYLAMAGLAAVGVALAVFVEARRRMG
ncbi:MFS transporter [Methylocapsa sp. S129]|uniref:MFS transporter n=1 Tax=Methylocapsa sp. S129 TaxID=1641869 RepID=UPI00131DA22E|nr:MFS transporter [Methylocapsa sp. S129]